MIRISPCVVCSFLQWHGALSAGPQETRQLQTVGPFWDWLGQDSHVYVYTCITGHWVHPATGSFRFCLTYPKYCTLQIFQRTVEASASSL